VFIAQLNDYVSLISDKNIDNDNMGDPLQQQTFHNVYKFITNISNVKHNQNISNQENVSNSGGGDQLTIILNGETILPHPTLSFATTTSNMTTNGTTVGDGVVKTVPNDSPPPRAMPTDIYLVLVIATVSLIVIGVIIYALYKAVKMLKLSLDDAREDSLPAPNNQTRHDAHSASRGSAGISHQRTRDSASNSSLPRSVSSLVLHPQELLEEERVLLRYLSFKEFVIWILPSYSQQH